MKIPLLHSPSPISRFAKSFAGNTLALVGAIVAVATFVSMITSETFRGWVRRNPYPIFIAFIVAIVVIMVLLNQLRDATRRYKDRLMMTPRDLKPTEHDKRLFMQFAGTLRSDSRPMRWLKQDFSPESLPWEQMHALEEAIRSLDLNPIGFDDQTISAAYIHFKTTAEGFRQKVQRWTKPDARNTSLDIPEEWRFEDRSRYQAALTEIQGARDGFVESYDHFLSTCHRLHVDSQAEPLNPG